jgi:hypothetical protein
MIWEHRAGMNNGLHGRPWGVQWCGSEGSIILNDQGYEIIAERKKESLDSEKKPGTGNPHLAHVRNFLDCVKSRKQPVLNLEIGHHVSTLAHLGNLSYRTGRAVAWDAANEKVSGDPQADAMVGCEYRGPWRLPYGRRS